VTARIRKVKCDEGHPACHRCISTGRVCDGYGIWGGGENFYSHRQRLTGSKDSRVVPRPPVSVSALASGTEENGYFEWFKCRTAIKLPGSFVSGFWTTLLFQASLNEPAVLHAVLALSSVHKSGTINADGQREIDNIPNEQEQFTLQHYVKAISHLQPHFSIKDRASLRVALITCIVFVCLEFLRGHFKTAQIHLQNGLKILGEMQMLSNGNDGILRLKPCRESTDDWIVEAFSRLHLQVELFRHAYQRSCLVLHAAGPETPALVFHSINEAWQQMERLLNKVFHLTHQGRQQAESECESLRHPLALLEHQQRIRTELAQWLDMYEAFKKALQGHRSAGEEKAYQLLCIYHTMANIMADTCLRPSDESVFDSHTNQFVLLIRQLANLWTTSPVQALPGHLMDMSRSVVDMGWIPLLYYAAVKCRVHRIRLQAIRLLECTSHREGIWDAKTAACVARKVMAIEERDFYKDVDTADDFPLPSSPRPQDLSLPTLPESYRIREVEVVLSGAPMDKILLFCKQKQEGIDCRVLISEYNVHSQRWIDGRCG
jgi:Fungal specific transcription factor domain/Fungal Zn(2)-Cys(6) binuclear cluster domain